MNDPVYYSFCDAFGQYGSERNANKVYVEIWLDLLWKRRFRWNILWRTDNVKIALRIPTNFEILTSNFLQMSNDFMTVGFETVDMHILTINVVIRNTFSMPYLKVKNFHRNFQGRSYFFCNVYWINHTKTFFLINIRIIGF